MLCTAVVGAGLFVDLGNGLSDTGVGFVDFVRARHRNEFGADLGFREGVPEVADANPDTLGRKHLPVDGCDVLVGTAPLPPIPLIAVAAMGFRPSPEIPQPVQTQQEAKGSHFHRVGGCGRRCCDGGQRLESRTDQEIGVLALRGLAAVDLIEDQHGDLLTPNKPLDVV